MSDNQTKALHGTGVALGLVFLSGFAALIYQVLWMKQISLLFGNTSQAASVTLASFFCGLAVGSRVLGKRVSSVENPLRVFAFLEIGIAVTALSYFAILVLFQAIYPRIYQGIGLGGLLLLIKFILSLLLVFPPAFCMGGTVPVLGQFLVRQRQSFGRISATIYGMNTLGAASGAALAGFYLPVWLGFKMTCITAILISGLVATVALLKSRRAGGESFLEQNKAVENESEEAEEPLTRQQRRQLEREGATGVKKGKQESLLLRGGCGGRRWAILFLGFLSGFGVLALEVLLTRLFSQVLENSVYTFAAILVVVLIFLALGALLSSLLSRLNGSPFLILTGLILAGAGAVMTMPAVFLKVTDGMHLLTSKGSWGDYVMMVLRSAVVVIGPPALLLGTIFPYLMKLEEEYLESPGQSLGRLASVNTVGAILGAMVCGFLLLDGLGIWRTLQLIALIYLLVALFLPVRLDSRGVGIKVAGLVLLVMNLTVFDFKNLPVIATDPDRPEEKILEVWEGSDCSVAVTENNFGRSIRINSDYSLGSTGAFVSEKIQADLPLMIYPETNKVFFLGLGTGITAGSALDRKHKIERLVACELVPEVVIASKKYMTDLDGFDLTGGLFRDRRAEILIEDGRHYLMAADESFDMINADLFVPFRSGAGGLYTLEHFESARERLEPGGVFVQWLPLHQLTKRDFAIIAQTMVEAFDQVSMWRHNFQPGVELVALVGHQEGQILPACEIDSDLDKKRAVFGKSYLDLRRLDLPLNPQTILLFYGGNLTAARALLGDAPINTDDRPLIEYLAPRNFREDGQGENPWFLGRRFADFLDEVQLICPPADDPLLANRTEANRRLPLSGSALHRAGLSEVDGDENGTRKWWEKFVAEWTNVGP